MESHEHEHEHDHYHPLDPSAKKIPLSKLQYLALVCDWISHAGDTAGTVDMSYDIATIVFGLPRAYTSTVTLVGTAACLFTSLADVRTCYRNMIKSQPSIGAIDLESHESVTPGGP